MSDTEDNPSMETIFLKKIRIASLYFSKRLVRRHNHVVYLYFQQELNSFNYYICYSAEKSKITILKEKSNCLTSGFISNNTLFFSKSYGRSQ